MNPFLLLGRKGKGAGRNILRKMTLQNHQVLTYFPGTSGARASLLSAKVARAA